MVLPLPQRFVLTLACANRPGIVAAVAGHLSQAGLNILDAQQYDDTQTDRFFMRVVFDPVNGQANLEELRDDFVSLAARLGLTWTLRDQSARRKVMLLVSKFDHCLTDLLYRWRIRELSFEPVGVIANHPEVTYSHVDLGQVPFHYLPVSKETKLEQEARVWEVIRGSGADVVILARYMQVLSDGLAAKLAGRCINIHHSFLPSFKGGKPYHQAHARGVKLIGATSHYVASDLDEGPIITQDVEPITHRDTPDDLVRRGRDIERRVLARAVRYHLEDRILLNGCKTVVFAD
ncbi:formyltetrahydrofolate deformylase [Microvirga sp. 0TCS3.31]